MSSHHNSLCISTVGRALDIQRQSSVLIADIVDQPTSVILGTYTFDWMSYNYLHTGKIDEALIMEEYTTTAKKLTCTLYLFDTDPALTVGDIFDPSFATLLTLQATMSFMRENYLDFSSTGVLCYTRSGISNGQKLNYQVSATSKQLYGVLVYSGASNINVSTGKRFDITLKYFKDN